MLSKCANPACSARFLYLHEGKIFYLELELGLADDPSARRVERFWLCGNCARSMTVVCERGSIITRPLAPAVTATRAIA